MKAYEAYTKYSALVSALTIENINDEKNLKNERVELKLTTMQEEILLASSDVSCGRKGVGYLRDVIHRHLHWFRCSTVHRV